MNDEIVLVLSQLKDDLKLSDGQIVAYALLELAGVVKPIAAAIGEVGVAVGSNDEFNLPQAIRESTRKRFHEAERIGDGLTAVAAAISSASFRR